MIFVCQLFVNQDVVLDKVDLHVAGDTGVLRAKVTDHGVDHDARIVTQVAAGFADQGDVYGLGHSNILCAL